MLFRSITSPSSSPVGLPPILTRKALQPRTPLVTLNSIDRSNNVIVPSESLVPHWQLKQCNDNNSSCCDNQNGIWMFESDNRCGYTDISNVQRDDSAIYGHHSGHTLNTTSIESQHQQPSTSRFYSDFDIIGELGQGSFGSVYKVRSREIFARCCC